MKPVQMEELSEPMNVENSTESVTPREPIQALWIGEQLGTMQRLSIASFLAQGHPFHLYTYGNPAGVPEGTETIDASSVLPESGVFTYPKGREKGSYAGFSDLFRYKMLLDHGGWWVDLDVAALRPFEFSRPHVFGRVRPDFIGTAVIRAPAGSELMRRCYEEALEAGQDIAWAEIGPLLFNRMIQELELGSSAEEPVSFFPIHWKDCKKLIAPGGILSRESYAVHLWHQMWQWGSKDPDGAFAGDSIYEKLKRKYLGG